MPFIFQQGPVSSQRSTSLTRTHKYHWAKNQVWEHVIILLGLFRYNLLYLGLSVPRVIF